MKVKLAKTAGFCMGVRRAIEKVMGETNRHEGPIYTYGPLIHNEQVMDLLKTKGVFPVKDITGLTKGTVVIRAHGIPPQERRQLKASGLRMVDATCPRVAHVQALIRYHTQKGSTVIIVGEKDHPEVIGLVGYGNGRTHVICTPEEVNTLPEMEKTVVMAQTTQEQKVYEDIVSAILKRFPGATICHTICDATQGRQEEARSLAAHVDGMVVVGGHHSGNTRRLAQVSAASGVPTFHVETEKELDREILSDMKVIGVTAGASTPNWMIKNVVQKIEGIKSKEETTVGRFLKRVYTCLFHSNFVVAFGAASLSYASAILAGRAPDPVYPSLAFLYVYAMHVLNRFLDKGATTYNDPERARFYRRHWKKLISTGLLAVLGALILSYRLGMTTFLVVLCLSLIGTVYSIPLVPVGRRHGRRYIKIKDIPGSKNLSEAIACAVIIAFLPLLGTIPPERLATGLSILFVFSLTFVRSTLFDILQLQGDLIVGMETLPIILGEKKTLDILKILLTSCSVLLILASLAGIAGPFSYLLLMPVFSMALCLLAYQKRWIYPGRRLEALIEANLLLAGLLAFCWHVLP